MTSKRKSLRDGSDRRLKRLRRRKRSFSEPAIDTASAEKQQALKRLFGRLCSVDNHQRNEDPPTRSDNHQRNENPSDAESMFGDENEDPLLEDVPAELVPEQLGFFVCLQETLQFMHSRGFPLEDPTMVTLRHRLLQGMDELAAA